MSTPADGYENAPTGPRAGIVAPDNVTILYDPTTRVISAVQVTGPTGATGPAGRSWGGHRCDGRNGAGGRSGWGYGATGPTGPGGTDGATGATGPAGDPGGATGATGPAGDPGGATGATGATGPAGATGPTGPRGTPGGATGATGPSGSPGGATGATGATGPASATGATGPQGATGASGADGATGPSGPGATLLIDYLYTGSEPADFNIDVPSGYAALAYQASIVSSEGHATALQINGAAAIQWILVDVGALLYAVAGGNVPAASASGTPINQDGILYFSSTYSTGADFHPGPQPNAIETIDGPVTSIGWQTSTGNPLEGSRLVVYGLGTGGGGGGAGATGATGPQGPTGPGGGGGGGGTGATGPVGQSGATGPTGPGGGGGDVGATGATGPAGPGGGTLTGTLTGDVTVPSDGSWVDVLTRTPAAGNYLLFATASVYNAAVIEGAVVLCIDVGGAVVSAAQRSFGAGALDSTTLPAVPVTLDGLTAVTLQAKWLVGTLTVTHQTDDDSPSSTVLTLLTFS